MVYCGRDPYAFPVLFIWIALCWKLWPEAEYIDVQTYVFRKKKKPSGRSWFDHVEIEHYSLWKSKPKGK